MSIAALCRLKREEVYDALAKAGGDGLSPLQIVRTIYPYVTQGNWESYNFEYDVVDTVLGWLQDKGRCYCLEVEPPLTYRFFVSTHSKEKKKE